MSVCNPNYPAGVIPWLADHHADLYNLLVSAIPDKLHKIWSTGGSLEDFEASLATWKQAHARAVAIFRKEHSKS